ncbi:hypothetical protein M885DRAFT_627100 [Pelagophyceae sp. CCMP2097]|nr:hypothetical protein M885DRAFT_627100 [Pelagophyceae sp. CCMP2097]
MDDLEDRYCLQKLEQMRGLRRALLATSEAVEAEHSAQRGVEAERAAHDASAVTRRARARAAAAVGDERRLVGALVSAVAAAESARALDEALDAAALLDVGRAAARARLLQAQMVAAVFGPARAAGGGAAPPRPGADSADARRRPRRGTKSPRVRATRRPVETVLLGSDRVDADKLATLLIDAHEQAAELVARRETPPPPQGCGAARPRRPSKQAAQHDGAAAAARPGAARRRDDGAPAADSDAWDGADARVSGERGSRAAQGSAAGAPARPDDDEARAAAARDLAALARRRDVLYAALAQLEARFFHGGETQLEGRLAGLLGLDGDASPAALVCAVAGLAAGARGPRAAAA